jgi:hypothetical protein
LLFADVRTGSEQHDRTKANQGFLQNIETMAAHGSLSVKLMQSFSLKEFVFAARQT